MYGVRKSFVVVVAMADILNVPWFAKQIGCAREESLFQLSFEKNKINCFSLAMHWFGIY